MQHTTVEGGRMVVRERVAVVVSAELEKVEGAGVEKVEVEKANKPVSGKEAIFVIPRGSNRSLILSHLFMHNFVAKQCQVILAVTDDLND